MQVHGYLCYYCHEQVAATIDHVVPHSWDEDNSLENLVPACFWCDWLASDMVFEDVEAKRLYILRKRQDKHLTYLRAVCNECLMPFSYREHGPSQFLCPECYDRQYGTAYSQAKVWARWLNTLRLAGFIPEAHRLVARRFEDVETVGRYDRFMALHDEIDRIAEGAL